MLAVVEVYMEALSKVSSASELTSLVGRTAEDFGFTSAFIIEYDKTLPQNERVLDSNPSRREWWRAYAASDLRPFRNDLARVGDEHPPLIRLDASRFGPDAESQRAESQARDLVDVVLVPVNHGGHPVGVAGFCGAPDLDPKQEMALQLISYTAFAHLRAANYNAEHDKTARLTPREREVLTLAADGMTSVQIGKTLGMSPRTANQHFDNVSAKLGTRNRAHTVAEAVRRKLLD